jgi:hypothetical protein
MDTLAQARSGGEHVVHCSFEKMVDNTPEHQGSHADQDRQRSKQIASMADDDSITGTKRTKVEQLVMDRLAVGNTLTITPLIRWQPTCLSTRGARWTKTRSGQSR